MKPMHHPSLPFARRLRPALVALAGALSLAACSAAPDASGQAPDPRLAEARAFLDRGDMARFLERTAEITRDPLPAAQDVLALVDLYRAASRFTIGLEWIDVYLAAHPGLAPDAARPFLERKLILLRDLRREREALTHLETLLVLWPEDLDLRYEQGELLAYTQQPREALAAFRAVREKDPARAEATVAAAALLLAEHRGDDVEQARLLLDAYRENHPPDVNVLYHRALAAESEADPETAVACYHQALDLDPFHLPTLCNLALLLETRDRDQALDLWKAAAHHTPKDRPDLRAEIEAHTRALQEGAK